MEIWKSLRKPVSQWRENGFGSCGQTHGLSRWTIRHLSPRGFKALRWNVNNLFCHLSPWKARFLFLRRIPMHRSFPLDLILKNRPTLLSEIGGGDRPFGEPGQPGQGWREISKQSCQGDGVCRINRICQSLFQRNLTRWAYGYPDEEKKYLIKI